MKYYGYNGKILKIDLSNKKTEILELGEEFNRIYAGGGLMGTFFMLKETLPKINPYDPGNLLIFMSSVISGLEGPGLAQFILVTKSPLSNGIAEMMCEGFYSRY